MTTAVRIVDQVPGVGRRESLVLEVAESRLSARELMRRRIFEEVARHNGGRAVAAGLVASGDLEGERVDVTGGVPRALDWQRQYDVALNAFERQRLILLVGQQQIESLDEEIALAPDTEVVFLRLVPLVGG